jgi:DNA helicase TIP49 (TBP-interacting protein)
MANDINIELNDTAVETIVSWLEAQRNIVRLTPMLGDPGTGKTALGASKLQDQPDDVSLG